MLSSRSFSDPIPKFKSKIVRLNHIALAYNKIDGADSFYKNVLNMNLSEKVPLEAHGVTTVFVNINDQYPKLELLEPFPRDNEASPIYAFLQKNPKGGIHHFCYDV